MMRKALLKSESDAVIEAYNSPDTCDLLAGYEDFMEFDRRELLVRDYVPFGRRNLRPESALAALDLYRDLPELRV